MVLFVAIMLQESYLFVEEDEDGQRSKPPRYTERYFVLFPFCGLKWYDYGVIHTLDPILYHPSAGDDSTDGACGWVFGGRIQISSVKKGVES